MHDDLFTSADVDLDVPAVRPERVLMSLNPEYYELIWQGLKNHEFRRRFLTGRPVSWHVYLTAPVSRLAAVVDLAPAVAGTPREIETIAEQMREGNGASVYEYLKDLEYGYAIPIRRVRAYAGFTALELADMLGSFHPPQGYTLIDRHPELAVVCDKLTASEVVRDLAVAPSPSLP